MNSIFYQYSYLIQQISSQFTSDKFGDFICGRQIRFLSKLDVFIVLIDSTQLYRFGVERRGLG